MVQRESAIATGDDGAVLSGIKGSLATLGGCAALDTASAPRRLHLSMALQISEAPPLRQKNPDGDLLITNQLACSETLEF